MIEVQDVSHRIGRAEILSGLSLSLPKGRLTALIGPNGAGKSTLLSLIGRITPLQSGRVAIDGMDVARTPSHALARHMAILSQTNVIGSRLRVAELVAFGRWPHHRGRSGAADHALVAQAIADMGLDALADRFLDELSGGQRQRAFIAATLAQGGGWLLLDEPLAALDMAHARAVMRHLAGLRDRGTGIVLVLHEINHAAAWADHIVALKAGRVAAEGPPETVFRAEVLGPVYDMDLRITEADGKPLVLHHL